MALHPAVQAELLDILAGAPSPLTTSELSRKVTAAISRQAGHGRAYDCGDVMVRNPGGYWEVPGRLISPFLRRHPDVASYKTAANSVCWALRSNTERWERETLERAAASAEVAARIDVLVDETGTIVRVDGAPVVTIRAVDTAGNRLLHPDQVERILDQTLRCIRATLTSQERPA